MLNSDDNSYSSPHSDMLDVTTFENNKVVAYKAFLSIYIILY